MKKRGRIKDIIIPIAAVLAIAIVIWLFIKIFFCGFDFIEVPLC